jgi:CTP synthase (UTP-ammonia lyase)
MRVRVAVVGDRSERFAAQDTIEDALAHSAAALGAAVEVEWIPTPALESGPTATLRAADAIWCAPGSPYVSLDGALEGIRYARESGTPFIGTCAGFQHGVVEVARNACGIERAHHAEYGAAQPDAPLFIDELLCSLVGQTMTVRLLDAQIQRIFGSDTSTERYYCRFGLNEQYLPLLAEHGLRAVGVDTTDGTTRIMRLDDHAFFHLTLFVPQTASTASAQHPLITAYVASASRSVARRN